MEQDNLYDLSQITNSLFISNAVVANDKLALSNNHITTIINASVEAVNAFFEDIQYVQVPVSGAPNAYLYDFFDPIADHIHAVELRNGRVLLHCTTGVSGSAAFCLAYLMKYHNMTLLDAHTWTKSCRPIIRPNNCFWEQLIHYEFKLFSKNTVHMINSPMGLIPNIYEKEAHVMEPI
ncbi:dual specificity phosphatase 21-like [Peromyscus maniculatus bairdii]|uniref:dual specificity phosphatase 21-like n=1 Tax=Peromyscus maniculatus bairdii TaxID=230844 RepID=UPI003FCFB551